MHLECIVRQAEVCSQDTADGCMHKLWYNCANCSASICGPTLVALGWHAWKTYLRLPEGHIERHGAMMMLGANLMIEDKYLDAQLAWRGVLSFRDEFDAYNIDCDSEFFPRQQLAYALTTNPAASDDDLLEAEALLKFELRQLRQEKVAQGFIEDAQELLDTTRREIRRRRRRPRAADASSSKATATR